MTKMEISDKPRQGLLFQAFLLVFVISKAQLGVGVLGFQRVIFKFAGHDAWISVIVSGLAAHLSIWLMIRTLAYYDSADLFGIHYALFGKWVGRMLSLLFMTYFSFYVLTISRTYIEAVQSWIFPDFPTWLLMLIIITLIIYGLTGGIRVIIGMCLFGFGCWSVTTLFFYAAIRHAQWSFLLPIMEATPSQVLQGASKMPLTLAGFEIIFFLYPFIRDQQNANRYAQIGVLLSNLFYLFVMVISIVYYSQNQMPKTIWATFSFLKIIRFPFLERFEYIAIPLWMLILVCNLMLFTWVILRGMKRVFQQNQKRTLTVFCVILFACSFLFQKHGQVYKMNSILNSVSMYVIFLYPPLLFLWVKIVHAIKKRSVHR
ncbi:GerAB/ArcD/ProY family transporter [Paenibacillus alginolyticus]|uniref:Spore germination protein n=1 Tax=Paenibacillus alginolyticus TaxID=59839 RepID=A0ABT4GE53_9BACL|nr:GerAB/ArcD/ProY family transporter [Paenibacillus alginolyticus]MCY9694460.1 spore germination protein [Paenibacillus alginolyticus]MEC0142046.1 GerAB/ArcD/ProY family transporter [Paenibacillus alginolyticus]